MRLREGWKIHNRTFSTQRQFEEVRLIFPCPVVFSNKCDVLTCSRILLLKQRNWSWNVDKISALQCVREQCRTSGISGGITTACVQLEFLDGRIVFKYWTWSIRSILINFLACLGLSFEKKFLCCVNQSGPPAYPIFLDPSLLQYCQNLF